MAKGLDLVRAPLTKFDSSLSAEQKQQLDAMGGGKAANPAGLCSTQNEEFTNVPTQEIEATVEAGRAPEGGARRARRRLGQGGQHAAGDVPVADPRHHRGRLEAVGKRL